MPKKEFKRPDANIMQRILEENRGSVAELALRLAWNLGLSREEMCGLKWSDVSLTEKLLYLPDRTVPMEEDEVRCLENRARTNRGQSSEYLMASDRNHTHMLPQSVSRVARTALDRGGLAGFTLVDLRQDYVIRLLEHHDWPYVARVSGTAVSTLYANYGGYYANGRGVKPEKAGDTKPDEFKLWKIIEAQGTSSEGLALWMAWKLGLQMQEMMALTWAEMDLERGVLQLPDRRVTLSPEFVSRLREVKAARTPKDDPHVLLTPQSRRPYDFARLSRSVRTALIHGGLEDLSFKDVIPDEKREREDDLILRHAAERGSVTRNEVMALLGLDSGPALNRLNALIERGQLVRIGLKCFLPGAVVPPEEHYAVLRGHLELVGSAFRKELADLLRIDGNQCAVVLRRLVAEGKLVKRGQLYALPENDLKK